MASGSKGVPALKDDGQRIDQEKLKIVDVLKGSMIDERYHQTIRNRIIT